MFQPLYVTPVTLPELGIPLVQRCYLRSIEQMQAALCHPLLGYPGTGICQRQEDMCMLQLLRPQRGLYVAEKKPQQLL